MRCKNFIGNYEPKQMVVAAQTNLLFSVNSFWHKILCETYLDYAIYLKSQG